MESKVEPHDPSSQVRDVEDEDEGVGFLGCWHHGLLQHEISLLTTQRLCVCWLLVVVRPCRCPEPPGHPQIHPLEEQDLMLWLV